MRDKVEEIVSKFPFKIDCNGNLEEEQFKLFIAAIEYSQTIYKTYKKQLQLFVDLFVEYIQPQYNPCFINKEISFFETLSVYTILILKNKKQIIFDMINKKTINEDVQKIVESSINSLKEYESFKYVKLN